MGVMPIKIDITDDFILAVYVILKSYCQEVVESGRCAACPFRVRNDGGRYSCLWTRGEKPFVLPDLQDLGMI